MESEAAPDRRRRAERLWMAGLWLFFCAWFLGVAMWKAPVYAELYAGVGLKDVPEPTATILAVCAWVARHWYLVVPPLLIPFVLVARGAFDGRSGPFTVVLFVACFLVITTTSLYLFIPLRKVQEKIQQRPSQP